MALLRQIKTDDTWKGSAEGPILANNEYDGEVYDARKEFKGWSQPGFKEDKWLKAEYRAGTWWNL